MTIWKSAFVGVALLGAVAALAPAFSQAAGDWVAIATSPDGKWGHAHNAPTREAAAKTAMSACGADACEVKFSQQAQCVAFAHNDSPRAVGFSWGPTKEEAGEMALANCKRRVPDETCTLDLVKC